MKKPTKTIVEEAKRLAESLSRRMVSDQDREVVEFLYRLAGQVGRR